MTAPLQVIRPTAPATGAARGPGAGPDRSVPQARVETVRPSAPATVLSTVAAFASARRDLAAACAALDDEYETAARLAIDAAGAVHPRLGGEIVEARESAERLRRAFTEHWGFGPTGADSAPEPRATTLPEWSRQAVALIDEVRRAYVPMRSHKRKQVGDRAGARVNGHLARLSGLEQSVVKEAFDHYHAAVPAVLGRALGAGAAARVDAARQATTLPPGLGGLDDRAVLSRPPVPGVGPLAVRAGTLERDGVLRLLAPHTGSRSFNESDQRQIALPLPSAALPLVLDLDVTGGFCTDDPATATGVLVRLLALLPAGRLCAQVFDPQSLGDSVRILFGLGDAAEKVIGTKVRTDARELSAMLSEVEDHLTFVTQKYLGGSYESLTEYNAAAGEVAEPYRMLLLFDFPRGFRRPDGSRDDESADRLDKIISAGPRCGVFTVVVAGSPDDVGSVPAVGSLPRLFTGKPLRADDIRSLTGLEPAALTESWPGGEGTGRGIEGMIENARIFLHSVTSPYRYQPEPPADPQVVAALLAGIERGLTTADDVRVDSGALHRLASQRMERAVSRGVAAAEVLPDPYDPGTWWRGDSTAGATATFGRVGAADIGEITFASEFPSALLGGRPGAGKSVLLHAIIGSLVRRYGPDQLELYMIDLREGVEFQVYAAGALPHARVVAVESDREFALSVLRSIDTEIARRGEILRGTGGEQVDLAGYRARTGLPMPRVLVVIDEFHVLFNADDAIATEASQLLDRVIRQGRGFGVHALLASQTLDGMIALGKHTLRQVPVRIALQSDEADSRIVLGEDNPDARLLSRAGEGILNRRGGIREANERFQTVFSNSTDREQLVGQLRERADRLGHTGRPVVFESRRLVEPDATTVAALQSAVTPAAFRVPVGMPMTLGGPVPVELRREAGGNLLVVADEERALPVLASTLVAARLGGAAVHLLDLAPAGERWPETVEVLAPLGGAVTTTRRNGFVSRLNELAELVRVRTERSDLRAGPVVVVLSGLHRARDLDAEDYDDEGPQGRLREILADGPDVGVHVVAWADKRVGVERRLRRDLVREFAIRLIGRMSADDGRALVDWDGAAGLAVEQLLLDDQDRGAQHRVRAYACPDPAWWTAALR